MTAGSTTLPAPLAAYATRQVEQVADALRFESSSEAYPARLASFVFRHYNGAWWTCCPETRHWHRNVQGQWVEAHAPVGRLIGPAWVADLLGFDQDADPFPDDDELDEPPDRSDSVAGSQAIAVSVAETRDEFSAGAYDSAVAEAILRKLYLLDGQGRAWTVGAASGEWYLLTDQGWQRDPAGPVGLAPADAPDHGQRVLEAQMPILAGQAPELPESMVSDWRPPQGLQVVVERAPEPEPATVAPVRCECGEVISELANYCPSCGSRAPAPQAAPSPASATPVRDPSPSSRPRRWRRRLVLLAVAVIVIRTGEYSQRDPEHAVYWFERAADEGHAESMFSLGRMYLTGDGVPRDPFRARKYFNQAADRGHVNAMIMAAGMFYRGEGGPVDRERAAELADRARRK